MSVSYTLELIDKIGSSPSPTLRYIGLLTHVMFSVLCMTGNSVVLRQLMVNSPISTFGFGYTLPIDRFYLQIVKERNFNLVAPTALLGLLII